MTEPLVPSCSAGVLEASDIRWYLSHPAVATARGLSTTVTATCGWYAGRERKVNAARRR
jgi:hypothetical protein